MTKTIATVAVLGAAFLPVGPAAAEAPGGQGVQTFQATCDAQTTTITTGGGASFYADGTKYVLKSFEGTFTPADGGAPQSFTKVYGNRTGWTGDTIVCTGSETSEEGTFSFRATGVSK